MLDTPKNSLLKDYILDQKFTERPFNNSDWEDYMTKSNKALQNSGNWQLSEDYEENSHYDMKNLMQQELENMIALYENIQKAS